MFEWTHVLWITCVPGVLWKQTVILSGLMESELSVSDLLSKVTLFQHFVSKTDPVLNLRKSLFVDILSTDPLSIRR